ncbi:hydroxyacid dehydrogenase [Pseudonocardia sp. CNS-004]|nr:hydroxyacid dehydrogenase [Pseudonocardia sp. CNS-004]
MPEAAVFVGPKPAPELVEAVRSAGGRLAASPAEASALVWYGGGPAEFPALAHPGIRWVQLPNAGVEPWFEAGLVTSERVFTSAAGSYAPAVAEHTLALLLAAAKQLPTLARARTWTRPSPATLRGATVGIVGAGGIGRALIAMLAPLGADVLAVTRSGREVPGARLSVGPDRLAEVLAAADHVVLAAPTTAATRSLIGAAELASMKPTAWLVNIGRGALVDTDALVAALAEERIGGAALDVTDPEPLPDGHPLWTEPRAMITPHSANSESLLLPELAKRVRENTERFLAGGPLVGVIDPVAGY